MFQLKLTAAVVLLTVLVIPGVAQEVTKESPRTNVEFKTIMLKPEEVPEIDGELDDACYTTYEPQIKRERFYSKRGELIPEDNETSVWMFQTPEAIIVAGQLFSAKPEELVATIEKDDIWGSSLNVIFNDLFTIALDFACSHQYKDETWVMVTPANARAIKIAGGKTERLVKEVKSAARRTEYGWSVEVYIPFFLFILPEKGEREIYVNFDVRRRYLDDQPWHWCWLGENDNFANMGKTRVVFPEAPRRTNILIDTSAVKKTGEGLRDGLRSGLAVRQDISAGWKVVATVLPDFENVAEDVETIDFSRQEIYRREKRPFLTECSDITGMWPEVYTRRIQEVDFGLSSAFQKGRFSQGTVGIFNQDGEGQDGYDYLLSKTSVILPGNVNTSLGYVGASHEQGKSHVLHFKGERKWSLFDLSSTWAISSGEETGYRSDTEFTLRCYGARLYLEHWLTQTQFNNPLGFYRGIDINTEGLFGSLLYEKVWEKKETGIARYVSKLSTYHYFTSAYCLDGGGLFYRKMMFRYWVEGHSGYALRCILTPETWGDDQDIQLDLEPQKIFRHTEKVLKYAFGVNYKLGRQQGETKRFVKPFMAVEWHTKWLEEDKLSARISYEVLRHIEDKEQLSLECNYDVSRTSGVGARLLRIGDQWFPYLAGWKKVEEAGVWPSIYFVWGEPNPYTEKPDNKRLAVKAEFRFDLRAGSK